MNLAGIPKMHRGKGGLSPQIARYRQKFRAELGAQYGLQQLPAAAEMSLAVAAEAKAADEPAKVASALLTAGRACEAAIRARSKAAPMGRAIPIQRTAAPRPWQHTQQPEPPVAEPQRTAAPRPWQQQQQQPPVAEPRSLVDRLLAVGTR